MSGITTLEEYFHWIKTLGQKSELGDRAKRYTMLPLDEDHFIINANTRAITIPSAFKKNGIAVQGDDLAEVVYFEIDRYFDYMDLNSCDIFIQWETPKGADGKTTRSVSPEYIRDIESKPGKLIFGWALSDQITKQAGQLKFSVRFFKWEDEEEAESGGNKNLVYSFSTLTASVQINPSINMDIEKENFYIDNCADRLVELLTSSEIVGGYIAAQPIFLKDLDDPNSDLVYDLLYDEDEDKYYYELTARAYSEDTGGITYSWKRQELDADNNTANQEITNSNQSTDKFSAVVENIYTEITDYNAEIKGTIYLKTSETKPDGSPIYREYTGSMPPSDEDINKGIKLFIKHSACVVDKVGVYWAVAENRITNSSSIKESKKAIFPRPKHIVITNQPEPKGILKGTDLTGKKCPLSVTVKTDPNEIKTYQWYRDPNNALNFNAESPSFQKIEGATEATYDATLPGHYKVKITNRRNNDEKQLDSAVSRVTNPASKPVIEPISSEALKFIVSSLADDNCPTIHLDSSIESDKYTVQWYLKDTSDTTIPVGPIQEIDTVALKESSQEIKSSLNPMNYEDEIIANSEQHDLDGLYYAIVTNYVNGDSITSDEPDDTNKFSINY